MVEKSIEIETFGKFSLWEIYWKIFFKTNMYGTIIFEKISIKTNCDFRFYLQYFPRKCIQIKQFIRDFSKLLIISI